MDIASVLLTGLIDLPWWGYIVVALALTHITIASITIFASSSGTPGIGFTSHSQSFFVSGYG